MTIRTRVEAITRLDSAGSRTDPDLVAIEAPLDLVVRQQGTDAQSLGLLMRTPGDDRDLVLGFLFTEGIIEKAGDVIELQLDELQDEAADRGTRATVTLVPELDLTGRLPERALSGSSACGLCGRVSLRALDGGRARTGPASSISAQVIRDLPSRLRAAQAVFADTGGLHAAALCDLNGAPWLVREDVGRHNAADKVVGAALSIGRLPAHDTLLAVSGRVAYEIVLKAAAAGVAAIVAVGAPSSLAIDAARAARLTLVGFARDGRFNIYTGAERIV